jgi:hypothetical protein
MKRMAIALVSSGLLMAAVSVGFAKDLTSAGLEEAFIDAVATCGPSSNIAGSLGKSTDPAVKIALRDALIVEAADDAAGVPGSNAAHSDCIRKDLSGRGYTAAQEAALPYCVKHDWPDPFTSLGTCVQSHGRLESQLNKQ